jgi:predicted transcriptional regulator
MIVQELVSDHLDGLRITDSVEGAIDFMVRQGVSELPIIDKKKLYNYARLASLHAVKDKHASLQDVILLNPFAPKANENQHIYEIVPILAANELSVLTVVDEEDHFVGVVDQKHINKLITESLTYRGIGAVVVLRLSNKDFAPSILARWTEENGAKIIGMMVNVTNDGELLVNLKLNTTMVKNIVATFQRQNYRIEQVYLAEDFNKTEDRAIDLAIKFFDL